MTIECDLCGKELKVGDWPMCPHGKSGGFTNVPDDVPGGFVVENGFDKPTRFYSHSSHREALAARGMELRVKHAGEHEKHLTRWDSVDLDGAKMLVSRGTKSPKPIEERIPITTADAGTFTYKLER